MDLISSKTAVLVILLVTASCLVAAEAYVFLPSKSTDEECQVIQCAQGTAHCIQNQCKCDGQTILDDARQCKFDDECNKKCPPKTIANCIGSHCFCSKNT
ncbi:hypothetical protein ACOSQ2_017997 [Xanthoceras sorbifolium]